MKNLFGSFNRDILAKFAGKLGLAVIPKWRLEDLPMSVQLSRIFEHHGIDFVLDVGANRGAYRDFLRNHVGYDGKILSFEPIPELAAALRERALGDPGWTIFEVGLADTSGIKEFNIMHADVFSSFRQPDHSNTAQFTRVNQISRKLAVNTFTLDDFVAKNEILANANHVFIKLDTQGYDLEVLKGATQFLKGVQAIQTELSFIPIYEGMPSFSTVLDFCDSCGFAPAGFYPVTFGRDLSVVEVDGILVRKYPSV